LILHHYDFSNYAEKARLALGYKGFAWRGVTIPPVAPKPDLTPLTGGYRRTPVLQIGADIYCDTALICDVLEHVAPLPSLYLEPGKGLERVVAQWGDTILFWASMAYSFSGKGVADMFANAPPEAAKAFGEDRKVMSVNMVRHRPGDAAAAYKSYLRRLSDMLDDTDYLLGAFPTVADFACYHPLWFTRKRTPSMADILQITPAVSDWMDRMAAIGHGTMETFDAAQAIAVAAANTPHTLLSDSTFQDEHGIALGSRVTIAGESFGPEAAEGALVAATRTHYTLERSDPRAGTVHVHFPRIGYVLRKAEAAA
jgi:glutathione S-transferase